MAAIAAQLREELVISNGVSGDSDGTLPSIPGASIRSVQDLPVDDARDLLGFKAYADALASVIDNRHTKPPLAVLINGAWGVGKSTLVGMVKSRLERKEADGAKHPHATSTFNAWMHHETARMDVALVAHVARASHASRTGFRRLAPMPLSLVPPARRAQARLMRLATIGVLLGTVALVLLLNAGLALPVPPGVEPLATGPWGIVVLAVVASSWLLNQTPVIDLVGAYLRNADEQARHASMQLVRDQLGRKANDDLPAGTRLVVFIEDLDRCAPAQVLQVLECMNQLLNHESLVVVVTADAAKLAGLVRAAQEATGTGIGEDSGNRFVEKVFQLQFSMPPPSPELMERYLQELSRYTPEPSNETEKAALPPAWRRWLKREWGLWTRQAIMGDQPRSPGAAGHRRILLPWATSLSRAAFRTLIPRDVRGQFPAVDLAALRTGSLAFAFVALTLFAGLQFAPGVPPTAWAILLLLASLFALSFLALMFLFLAVAAVLLGSLRAGTLRAELKRPRDASRGTNSDLVEHLLRFREDYRRAEAYERLVDDSPMLRRGLLELAKHFPPVPRFSKRILNRLRLELFIAQQRGELGVHIQPEEIAKWVVIAERWPSVERLVRGNPATLKDFPTAELMQAAGASASKLTQILELHPQIFKQVEALVLNRPAATV